MRSEDVARNLRSGPSICIAQDVRGLSEVLVLDDAMPGLGGAVDGSSGFDYASAQFRAWPSRSPQTMTSPRFTVSEGMEVLSRTPSVFRAMLHALPLAWLDANEGPDTFSPRENLAHVIHGERTDWIPRARIILARGAERRFASFDRFAHRSESRGKSIAQLLDEFTDLRARNLETLTGWQLGDEELSLTGEHPALGTVTLRQLLATWVVHDLGHLAQTARVMAKRYGDVVGPWKAYLPIVTR